MGRWRKTLRNVEKIAKRRRRRRIRNRRRMFGEDGGGIGWEHGEDIEDDEWWLEPSTGWSLCWLLCCVDHHNPNMIIEDNVLVSVTTFSLVQIFCAILRVLGQMAGWLVQDIAYEMNNKVVFNFSQFQLASKLVLWWLCFNALFYKCWSIFLFFCRGTIFTLFWNVASST